MQNYIWFALLISFLWGSSASDSQTSIKQNELDNNYAHIRRGELLSYYLSCSL